MQRLVTNNDTKSINSSLIHFNNYYIKQMNAPAEIERYNKNMRNLFAVIAKFQEKMIAAGGHFNYDTPSLLTHSTNLDVVLATGNELSQIEPCFEILEHDFRAWNAELEAIANKIAKTVNDIGHAISGNDGGNSEGTFDDLIAQYQEEAALLEASLTTEQIVEFRTEAAEEAQSETEEIEDEVTETDVRYGLDETYDYPTTDTGSVPASSKEDMRATDLKSEIYDLAEELGMLEDDKNAKDAAAVNAKDAANQAEKEYNEAQAQADLSKAQSDVIYDLEEWPNPGEVKTGVTENGISYTVIGNEDGTMTVTTSSSSGFSSHTYDGSLGTAANEAEAKAREDQAKAVDAEEVKDQTREEAIKASSEAEKADKEYNEKKEELDEAEKELEEHQAAAVARGEAESNYNTGGGNDYSPQNPPVGADDDLDGKDISE